MSQRRSRSNSLMANGPPSTALLQTTPHRIQLEDYISYLVNHTETLPTPVHLSLSAGGMAAVYMSGIVGYLTELIRKDKLVLGNIYTASAGAITALFVIQSLHYQDHPEHHMSLDTILHYVNEDVRDANAKGLGITEGYLAVLRATAPPDLYLLCNNRVYISFHVLTLFGGIKRMTISQFASNEHLFACATASATVPYVSINAFFTTYICPFCDLKYFAMDGLYTDIVDDSYPTICVDLGQLDFPVLQRMFLTDKHCEVWALRGIYDLNYLLNYQVPCKSLYFYEKSRTQHVLEAVKATGKAWYGYLKKHPMNLLRFLM